MYKIIIILFLSVNCFGQKDTANRVPADTLAFISVKDMNEFLKWLPNNFSYAEYTKLKPEQVMMVFYNWAVTEWNKRKRKK